MKRFFQGKNFSAEARELIDICNTILDDYESQGYDLSTRQLYYQLVSRNLVENTEKSYKRVAGLVSDARLAGLLDWEMIKDRGRECITNPHWTSPAHIAKQAAKQFRIDLWDDQPFYCEVMVEKQALEGVLQPVCSALDVPFSANKGYGSSSTFYEAGCRFAEKDQAGKDLVIFYLGDHDPSGMDMTRDVEERLNLFAMGEAPQFGEPGIIEVRRLALNMPQIRRLNPPENPAKLTDSRAEGYIERFGRSSWELDAIEPRALADLVTRAVVELRDENKWIAAVARQDAMRAELKTFAENYGKTQPNPKPRKKK